MVDAELMNRPMVLARFRGNPIIENMGTSATAEPTPPDANTVETMNVTTK